MNDYTYDRTGLDLTENSEGLKLTAYPDPGTGGAPWTVGYGHTGADVYQGMKITQAQAEEFLMHDIQHAENTVKDLVKVPLTQNQFDALVDFCFNCGCGNFEKSTLLKCLNAGQYDQAQIHFSDWVMGGGHVLPGLVTRRHKEAILFG